MLRLEYYQTLFLQILPCNTYIYTVQNIPKCRNVKMGK